MARLDKQQRDMVTNFLPDTATFTSATPEHCMVFVGPPRFILGNVEESISLTKMLLAARRSIFFDYFKRNVTSNDDIKIISNKVDVNDLDQGDLLEKFANNPDLASAVSAISSINKSLQLAATRPDGQNVTLNANYDFAGAYKLLGMTQGFNPQIANAQTPVGAIGSKKKAFIVSKAGTQVSVSLDKIMYLGGTMVKSLLSNTIYEAFLQGRLDETEATYAVKEVKFGSQITDSYIADLSSDLTKVPIGIGAFYFDRTYQLCDATYVEGAHIANLSEVIQAGNPQIIENVQLMGDHARGLDEEEVLKIINTFSTFED